MRCRKCGYVTFDRRGDCPKCGKSLPDPLLAAALSPRRPRGKGLFLSPLATAPVPRFYGQAGDPGVVSLLAGGAPAALSEAALLLGEEASGAAPPAVAKKAPSPGEDLLEDLAAGAAPPAGAGREAAAAEEEDLLASLDLEEASPPAAPPPAPEPDEAEQGLEELLQAADKAPQGEAQGAAAPAEGEAPEEEEDLSSLLEEASSPPAPAGGKGKADLANMWDDAFAEQEAAAKAGKAGGEAGEVAEGDLEKMWAEALDEAGEAEAKGEAAAPTEEPGPEEGLSEELDISAAGGGEAQPASLGEDPSLADAEAPAPAGKAPAGEEDSEEIEAYVPEEETGPEPPPAEPAGRDDFFGEDASREAEEEEPEPETVGVPLAHRFVAGAVDFGILAALGGVFAAVTHLIVKQAAGPIFANMEALALVLVLNLVVLFLLSIFYSVYFVGVFGRTPGQRCFGLSVVNKEDKRVEYLQAILRYFGGLAATLPLGLGHLVVCFDKERRGLGDRLAGTRVVTQVNV